MDYVEYLIKWRDTNFPLNPVLKNLAQTPQKVTPWYGITMLEIVAFWDTNFHSYVRNYYVANTAFAFNAFSVCFPISPTADFS